MSTSFGDGWARITLLGVFRLQTAKGAPVFIPSKKARALLGILALSRQGERSRVWLQGKLWCRCERSEAQSSLRRELSTLRATLSKHGIDLIDAGRDTIRLRLDRCRVDVLDEGTIGPMEQFLEGLDIAGEPEFEEWLREIRNARAPAVRTPVTAIHETTTDPPIDDHRLTVQVQLDAWHDGSSMADFLPEMLRQRLFAGLDETGYFRVLSGPDEKRNLSIEAPDLSVLIKTTAMSSSLGVIIMASIATNRTLLFSVQDVVSIEGNAWDQSLRQIFEIAANCIDRIVRRCVANDALRDERHLSRKALLTAVEQMFSLSRAHVRASRATLARASGIGDSAVFHAWKAYQAVFLQDAAHTYDYDLTLEECRENISRALEADPHSGLALSLCAHVEAFLFRDYSTASELIDRAGASGTRHVMYFDTLALIRFYSGQYANAKEAALMSVAVGQNVPFRYCFSTTLCMIDSMSGNFKEAAAHGHRALALEPSRKDLSYPPTLRYLGSALALTGERERAREVFASLAGSSSPNGSALLAPNGTPIPGRGCADLISAGVKAAGF